LVSDRECSNHHGLHCTATAVALQPALSASTVNSGLAGQAYQGGMHAHPIWAGRTGYNQLIIIIKLPN
jgi:hypothetical protein